MWYQDRVNNKRILFTHGSMYKNFNIAIASCGLWCYAFYYLVASMIFKRIVNKTVNALQNVNFTCQATGEPVPNISWYFNGVMINVSDTNKYMIMSTSINTTTTENTLTIYDVTSSDVGNYPCFASNVIGNDSKAGYLQVNGELYNATNDVHFILIYFSGTLHLLSYQ